MTIGASRVTQVFTRHTIGVQKSSHHYFNKPPYAERHVRWCERTGSQLMATFLLDQFCSYHTIKYDMNKSTDFTGQPIFSQLLSLLNQSIIKQSIREHKANRCYKKFRYIRLGRPVIHSLSPILFGLFFTILSINL